MAKSNRKNFVELLGRSGLVEEDTLKDTLDQIKSDNNGELPGASAIADYFVDKEIISRWHADKLLDGKYKGFFLGKYKLLRHLGSGGMSSVYLAEHVWMQRRVAIKVLLKTRVGG